ncbi:MAG: Bacillolysin precursor [Microgenomates bacterium OLB22]|nr:MAG: Bacillolysin precursor [Microgenomates bacterium OLB22]
MKSAQFEHNPFIQFILAGLGLYAVVMLTMLSVDLLSPRQQVKTKATGQPQFDVSQVEQDQAIAGVLDGTITVDVSSNKGLITIPSDSSTDVAAAVKALEVLENTPLSLIPSDDMVQGISTSDEITILPEGFSRTAKLVRTLDEAKVFTQAAAAPVKHYYFQQQIKVEGKLVPVFGTDARVSMMQQDEEETVIGVGATVLGINPEPDALVMQTGSTDTQLLVDKAQAQAKVFLDNPALNVSLCVGSALEDEIVNKSILGISSDTTNYLTKRVPLCVDEQQDIKVLNVFIDPQTQEAIFIEPLIYDALQRRVSDCSTGSCQVKRTEGSGPSNSAEADKAYDLLKKVYDYFKTKHNRDSFDGRGAPLVAEVNYSGAIASAGGARCPNAVWLGAKMAACRGLVLDDVWAHEITHGVTFTTSNLLYQNQSGALNESFSDIFGWAVDPDDFAMGNIRRLDDPTRSQRPQPDKLFSPLYHTKSTDQGGVHINSGILNKAFYLMVAGGNFNDCTIQKADPERVLEAIYKALTVYLNRTSNFKSAYTAINRACADIHGASSPTCATIEASMQATQMDQMGSGQTCPECNSTRGKVATCAGKGPQGGGDSQPPQNPQPSGSTRVPANPPRSTATPRPTARIGGSPNTGNRYPTTSQRAPTGSAESPVGGNVKSIDPVTECPVTAPTSVERAYSAVRVTCTDGRSSLLQKQTCTPLGGYKADATTFCAGSSPPAPRDGGENTPAPVPGNPQETGDTVAVVFQVQLQGVTDKIPPQHAIIPMRVGLSSRALDRPLYVDTEAKARLDGKTVLWEGKAIFKADPRLSYQILLKGPVHIQRKFCHEVVQEREPGAYLCAGSSIPVSQGTIHLNASTVPLFACDVPEQNGICNSLDLSVIKDGIGSIQPAIIIRCDMNLDGVCNAQDYVIALQAFLIRLDEE